jgi:tetratricopeptide (TPR) repeat protein
MTYHKLKKPEQAIADLNTSLRLDPNNPVTLFDRGKIFSDRGSYRPGLADFMRALELEPTNSRHYNQLAWVLATCPKAEFRDGARAVELATRAAELTEWKDGNVLDTLAAAYAESGRFDEAVRWQKQAVDLATPQLAEEMRQHLELYQAGKPCRTAPVESRTEAKGTPWWKKKRRR